MKPRRTLAIAGSVKNRGTISNVADIDARRQLLHELQKQLNDSARRAGRAANPIAVHDLRVATRRLRILLRALRHDVDPAFYAGVRFELRNLAGIAGPAREAYVRKQTASPWLDSLSDRSAQTVKACFAILNTESERATRRLHIIMQGREWSSSLARINRAIASPRLFGLAGGSLRVPLSNSYTRLLRDIDHALRHKVNPADKIHRLRIKTRNATYLGGMLGSLSGQPDPSSLLRLRKMQSALGNLHDVMQFRGWLLAARLPDPARQILLRKVGTLKTRQLDRCRKQRKALRHAMKQLPLARRVT